MSATLRLVWIYFTATRLIAGLAATGILFLLFGAAAHLLLPFQVLYDALYGRESGILPLLAVTVPWFGVILLLASISLMPLIVERLALGRAVWVLPYGRIRLVVSVLLTASLQAVVIAGAATIAFGVLFYWRDTVAAMFWRTLVMVFIDFGLICAAIWLVGRTQGIWRLLGTLAAIFAILVPVRVVGTGGESFSWIEWLGIGGWLVFGTLLLAGGRMRHFFSDLKRTPAGLWHRLTPAPHYRAGNEVGLLLGMTHPWLMALGQVIPVGIMAAAIEYPETWLPVLQTFSAMTGAVASQAASRARRFWLRVDRTRDQIADHVELAFWRFNAGSLAVLLICYWALAGYAGFSLPQVTHGSMLLILGCASYTYLGLMTTRGPGWIESLLCILTMSALVIAAVATMRDYFTIVIELEILLAALIITYRTMARARWAELDWMRCRA